jgi:hypothetical protein
MLLEALSVSHGKASAYLPVLELLSQYFEISRDDDDRKRRERVLGKVLGLDRTLEDSLPYLYSLQAIAILASRWRRWTHRSGGGAPWMRLNASCHGRASISR